jgi:hypothetical protein
MSQTNEEVKRCINVILGGGYSDNGKEQWWKRPRHALDGQTPEEALAEGQIEKVTEVALGLIEAMGT